MQIPLAFADPSIIEEVSLSLWCELFDTLGWPTSLVNKKDSLTHEEIMSAFRNDTLSDELLQAIETIHDLGAPRGRETITSMLADRQIPTSTLPQGFGERETALHLFLAQRNDGVLAEVFSRAQVQIHDGNHRRYNDFIGKRAENIRNSHAKTNELGHVILEYCKKEDLGKHVEVRVFDDDDGVYHFQIMRSHHTRTPLAVLEGSASRAKIEFRPVHADHISYEPKLGRIRITARAASIIQFYCKAFGYVMFKDDTFFDGSAVCSLRVLQDRGRAALENHGVFGVGRVWMTECIWERGDREKLNFRATDCFDSIESLNIPFSEGQIIQAKFKIMVTEKSSRPVTVTVRIPSRIEVTQVRHESLINEVLDTIGIRNIRPNSPAHNIWTLYPWRQPIGIWRDCFGTDTELLATNGVLKKTILNSIEPPLNLGAGHILQVEQISNVEYLGISQTPEIPSRSLSVTDLDGLELVVSAFQNHLRQILGITSNAAPFLQDSWFLDLGVLHIDGYDFRIFYAIRQPPSNAATGHNIVSTGSTNILLLPTGIKEPTGITEILLDKTLPNQQRVVRDIIAATNLTGQVSALVTAPPRARLVVDNRLKKVWFDKIEIAGLKAGTQPYRFVMILAKNYPESINSYDLTKKLSDSRTDGDQTARSAKAAASKHIKAAIEAQGLSFENPFKTENNSYRLTIPAYITDLPSQSETEVAPIELTN